MSKSMRTWKESTKKKKWLLAKVLETIDSNRKIAAEKYRDIGMGDAFYNGHQYGEWDETTLSWTEEEVYDDEPRLMCNLVKIHVDHAVSKITRYKPSIMTTPESNHEKDIRGSEVAEELLHHEFRENNFDDLEERWVKGATKYGISFLNVDWDPNAKDRVIIDNQKEGNVRLKVEEIFEGDITYRTVKPINMVWDLTAESNWKDAKWVIEIMSVDPETLLYRFPDMKDKIDASISKNGEMSNGESDRDPKEAVLAWKFYYKPCPEFEEGYEAFGIDTAVLEANEFPFEHGKLPYIPLIYSTDDDFLFGKGIPQVTFELQTEYNKVKNIKIINENYSSAIKFMNPEGSGYDSDEMTNRAGEVIYYAGDREPHWSQPQTVSQELNDSLDRIRAEFQDITYVGSTSQGKPPEGIRSGIAIQYLIENDDLNFAGVIRRKENAMLEVCYMILSLMRQYFEDEDERFYKVIGENKQYQLKQFKKTNLDGKYDIIIQNSNANPLSKAYKMDTIMQLVQYGILNQEDRGFIGENLQLGNLKGVYEDLEADRVRAMNEIDDMMSGKPHQIMEFDDHLAHFQTKVRYLKKEYSKLSDDQKQIILAAANEHKSIIDQMQQEQMQQQMMQQQQGPMQEEGMTALGGQEEITQQ